MLFETDGTGTLAMKQARGVLVPGLLLGEGEHAADLAEVAARGHLPLSLRMKMARPRVSPGAVIPIG